jgi:hypothetical protein
VNSVLLFCEERRIPDNISEAFLAFLRSDYAHRFEVNKNSETIRTVIRNLSFEQVEEAWQDFVVDLRNVIIATVA